jgi:CheY-like chemotaxis protein
MAPRILVIDDELYILRLMDMILERNGYEPVLASNAGEGLQALQENQIAAVTCDLMMPGMSGMDFIKRVQADPCLCHIPVILVTAAGTEEDLERARRSGAASALIKPFSERSLIDLIRQSISPSGDLF